MGDKKKLARQFARNEKRFESDFEYLHDIEFLIYLEAEYSELGRMDVCSLIQTRLDIYLGKIDIDEGIETLNLRIKMYKNINRNLN